MRYRLAPRRYSKPVPGSGFVVRVTEDLRQSVVFLGVQEGPMDTAPIDPRGVGFLVWGRVSEGGGTYLVTARHVADKLDPPFVIRFNKIGGGSDLVHIDTLDKIWWFPHPDNSVDLVVAPIEKPDWSDNIQYSLDDIIEYDYIRTETGVGDSVFISGLFYFVHGTKRNLPVTYHGHVALMPSDDRIPITGSSGIEGYLVQANPISGCSGAPVWVHQAVQVEPPQGDSADPVVFWAEGRLSLLGFWSSSWKVRGSEIIMAMPDHAETDSSGNLAPLGMGVVVPANKLVEIFDLTDVAKERAALHKKKRVDGSASPDFAERSGDAKRREHRVETGEENPRHLEDFRHLVDVAARKRPQGDQT